MQNCIYIIPTDRNKIPVYGEVLVKVDKLNNTLQWIDHWKVNSFSSAFKKELEENVTREYPDYKWMHEYRTTGESSSTVWSTSEEEAKEVFERMDINNDKIERI